MRNISQLLMIAMIATLSLSRAVAQDGDAASGETLFNNNCKACHSAKDEVVVGPGLKGIQQRRDLAWLVKWVKNPNGVIQSGDEYAVALYNKFNKAQMTAFPAFGDKEVKDILAYIEKANTAVAAAPAAGGATAQAAGGSSEPSDLFTYILVALLLVMLLVLGVLLAIVTILSKAVSGEVGESDGSSFGDSLIFVFLNFPTDFARPLSSSCC